VRPEPDQESGPYWDGLGRHRVVLQRCPACGAVRFPPMPTCPRCAAEGGSPVESPATGVVYSFVRVHRAFSAEHAADVPYTVAVVELDEGCRMLGRIAGGRPAGVGDRVGPAFADHDGWTELQFRVDGDGGPEGRPVTPAEGDGR
jgi:uncharacterized OB-fold protein